MWPTQIVHLATAYLLVTLAGQRADCTVNVLFLSGGSHRHLQLPSAWRLSAPRILLKVST